MQNSFASSWDHLTPKGSTQVQNLSKSYQLKKKQISQFKSSKLGMSESLGLIYHGTKFLSICGPVKLKTSYLLPNHSGDRHRLKVIHRHSYQNKRKWKGEKCCQSQTISKFSWVNPIRFQGLGITFSASGLHLQGSWLQPSGLTAPSSRLLGLSSGLQLLWVIPSFSERTAHVCSWVMLLAYCLPVEFWEF